MIDIGLSGNVCSGYDKIAKILAELYEVPVFDADIALKFLINYRIDVTKDIRITFGSDVYEKDLLKPSYFNTTEKFDKLIDIAQPELFETFYKWRTKIQMNSGSKAKGPKYCIFKSSILFERKFNDKMDYNLSVFRPKNERAMDLSKATGVPLMQTYDIVATEMDELEKNGMSKWTIHNYDNLSLLAQSEQFNVSVHEAIAVKEKIVLNNLNRLTNEKNKDTSINSLEYNTIVNNITN